MKKKLVSLVLCLGMIVSTVAGCSNSADNSTTESRSEATTATGAEKGEEETVIMYTPFAGNNEDKAAVVAAINEITTKEIGVKLQWEQFDIGQWFQQYSLFLSGSDDIDLLFNFGGISSGVAQGAFMDITDLVDEYGTGIKDTLGDYIKSGQIGGKTYGLIPNTSFASTYGIMYRKDIVKELGLEDQVASVKTLEDWGAILEAVKAAHPEMTPYVTAAGSSMSNFFYGDWDSLGDSMGVLMDSGSGTKVENLFETEEYTSLCKTMSDWYEAGYTSKDIQTQTDSYNTLCSQGVAFSALTCVDFNTELSEKIATGKDIGVVMLSDPFVTTYTNGAFAVMANSKHAEAAVKFMNMVYTDKRILDLMSYGIEGTNYQVLEDGSLDYVKGQDPSSCTYHDQLGISSNNVLRSLWTGENPNLGADIVTNNESAKKSSAMGFVFDNTSVSNQVTKVSNVFEKYRNVIECGALNADENLPALIKELKDAGIDDIIAEKQKQLDEWSANQ